MKRRGLREASIAALVVAAAGCAVGCTRGAAPRAGPSRAALVGVDAVPAVHLVENHSSALTVWRQAGVRDRVLLHIDGQADLDWLPDATVARIAASTAQETAALELHPYTLDGSTLRRFAAWNFVYPAFRLGLVREVVWVVPDGSLADRSAAARLVRDLFVGRLHRLELDEAEQIRFEEGQVRATLIGVPIRVCELANLPAFDEPVLLDIDLGWFTTLSAATQEVLEYPRRAPDDLVRTLARHGVRTDLATLSFSTIGGFFPPANRWMGRDLQRLLRGPGPDGSSASRWSAVTRAREAGPGSAAAIAVWRDLTSRAPDDAAAWYSLARELERQGAAAASRDAAARALALDPVLAHAPLFEADRSWANGAWADALRGYRSYVSAFPASPFAVYARRREAGCLMRLERDDEAIAAFRRVVEAAPSHADSRLDLGVLLRQAGRLDEAIDHLAAARAILPELGTYALALGTTYLRAGRFEEAVVELEEAVARRPTWAPARAAFATALVDVGRFDEAAAQVRLGRALEPENPQFTMLDAAIRRGSRTPAVVRAGP